MNDVSKKVEKSLHISQDVIAQIVTNSVNEIEAFFLWRDMEELHIRR